MGRRVRLLAGIGPWFVAGAFAAALASAAPRAGAGQAPLALGKVTTRGDSKSLEIAFKAAVEHELAGIDLSTIKPADRYVLSASLVKMDTLAEGDRAHATCVVSAVLTRQRGGALHAIISGRARVEDASAKTRSTELSAMRAAVHNALIRVPEALR